MKVLVLGFDGYLGWPLVQHLAAAGHTVAGLDNGSRRILVSDAGSHSALPIYGVDDRIKFAGLDKRLFWSGDAALAGSVDLLCSNFKPDAIVHLAEMPSAPWSMESVEHAVACGDNNVNSTLRVLFAMRDHCPNAHLVKLGSMGEYGTPPNGSILESHEQPRYPGSFYHASKVADSFNVEMACRLWGLHATDIMQGVVYGTRTDVVQASGPGSTRFDFDSVFGTVVNRFCAQAIQGWPITPYGSGEQIRGFLGLRESMECIELLLSNPPASGSYRVVNQLARLYSMNEVAEVVRSEANGLLMNATVENIENPRVEREEHDYNVVCSTLPELGFEASKRDLGEDVREMLTDLHRFRGRIASRCEVLLPSTRWDGNHGVVLTKGRTLPGIK